MNLQLHRPWVPIDKIEILVQPEPALIIAGLTLGAWLCYKILLGEISEDRHRLMKAQFRNLSFHLIFGALLFFTYYSLKRFFEMSPPVEHLSSYIGLITLLSGAVIFVKISKLLTFEYLFLSHMRVAVPLLLVDLFTFILTLILCGWIAAEIFNIRLISILATSAIFSLVLGLALQDTLGNLLAGVVLQFDKPYEIGDWIEIHGITQKWIGQVLEISWRATVLIGLHDEAITVPNRTMAQTQISNYSSRNHPILRSHVFQFPHSAPIFQIREALTQAAQEATGVRQEPVPFVLVNEANETGLVCKLFYFIDNYGEQYLIADRVISACTQKIEKASLKLASPRLLILEGKSQV